jgi:hypothetical protein
MKILYVEDTLLNLCLIGRIAARRAAGLSISNQATRIVISHPS